MTETPSKQRGFNYIHSPGGSGLNDALNKKTALGEKTDESKTNQEGYHPDHEERRLRFRIFYVLVKLLTEIIHLCC